MHTTKYCLKFLDITVSTLSKRSMLNTFQYQNIHVSLLLVY